MGVNSTRWHRSSIQTIGLYVESGRNSHIPRGWGQSATSILQINEKADVSKTSGDTDISITFILRSVRHSNLSRIALRVWPRRSFPRATLELKSSGVLENSTIVLLVEVKADR